MDKRPLIVVSLCAVVLLVLGSLSNVAGYQTVKLPNQEKVYNKLDRDGLSSSPPLSFKQYRVFGTGDGWWIDPFNATWYVYLFEGNDTYSYHTRGLYYKTNIYIVNHGGMQSGLYCLFIKDRQTRTLYNKTELPYRFIIYNFTGLIDLMYYSIPHGPQGCFFTLCGNAEDFQVYSP
jgi:hypothetical protein